MKTAKILSCGILSILFIACGSDSSGTAAQTDELADGSVVAPDGGIIGSSGSVDFTSSANTDPFDTSFTGRSYALISSATFGISSSSTGLIGSSAGGSANPGIGGSNDSPDTDFELVMESLRNEINRALLTLNERERHIIEAFFGINQPEMTLEEIGEKFGLTRERVRQIKEKAIRRLRHNTKNKLLRSYLGQ